MILKNYKLSTHLDSETKLKYDFYDACASNDLDKVKNILLSQNPKIFELFTKDYDPKNQIKFNDPIDISIIRKSFNVTKYLLNDKFLKKQLTIDHYIKYYDSVCKSGEIEIIDILLNNHKFNNNSVYEVYKQGILNCAQFNHLDAIKYFRNLPNRKQNSSEIKDENYSILSKACKNNNVKIFEYIWTYPKIKNYKLKKEELDTCIYICFCNNSFDVINFFIFNLNLELNSLIKKHLENKPNEKNMIENWFISRDLAIGLNKELNNLSEVKHNKKNKI